MPYILSLPNELLIQIFRYLRDPEEGTCHGSRTTRVTDFYSLIFVCRRVYHVIKPLLYVDLYVCYKPWCEPLSICGRFYGAYVHRTLREGDEEMRSCCKRLNIAVADREDLISVGVDLARWLTGIEELLVVDWPASTEEPEIRAGGLHHRDIVAASLAASSSYLRSITIAPCWAHCLNLIDLFKPSLVWKYAASLQYLRLDNVSRQGHPDDLQPLRVCKLTSFSITTSLENYLTWSVVGRNGLSE